MSNRAPLRTSTQQGIDAPQSMPEHLQTSDASKEGVTQAASIFEAIDNLTREVRALRQEIREQRTSAASA